MWKLELSGTVIHFFLLVSIFDIYLQQEVYQGLYQNCSTFPLAKRLVLIVFNGGMAGEETLKVIKTDQFVSQKMKSGIWGLAKKNNLMKSNGITAISGGFEQNPMPFSSIYGHENTEFDHIFNYASKTFYVGGLTTLDYFGKTSTSWKKYIIDKSDLKNNTNMNNLLSKFEEDIQSNNTRLQETNLIIFVQIPTVTRSSNKDELINEYNNKIISDLFKNDINRLVQTIDRLYNDNETTYMLCSENELTNNELFMIWGKGVNSVGEATINMKDISLMASTILGNPIPLSCIGTWHKSFLRLAIEEEETAAIACNAFHLSSMANRTLQQVGNKLMEALHLNSDSDSQILEEYQKHITTFLSLNNYSEINELSEELTTFSLKILEKDVIFMKSMIFYLTHSLFLGWSVTLMIQLILVKITKHPDQQMRIEILRKKTELWFFGIHTLLILIGTTSIMFIVIKEWPVHYMFYWLITTVVWGYVLSNLQTWIAVIDNLNFQKLGIILLYIVIYAIASESFIWGFKYKLIFCGTIVIVNLYNWIKCYIMKKPTTIQLSSILSGMTLAAAVLLLKVIPNNPMLVIITGIILPIISIICSYYMRYNAYDFLIMTISVFLCGISLIIKSFKIFHPVQTFEVMSWIIFVVGIFFPVLGGFDKMNRLQHIAVCLGSSIIILSISYEPLIVAVVFIFSFFCTLINKPQHKTKFLNKDNSFQVVIFTMLTLAVLHLMGMLDQSKNQLYIISDIYEKIKLLLILLIALTAFTAIKHVNGGDSQFVMSMILLHYCGYRLFLDLEFDAKVVSPRQMNAYCSLQIAIIILFATHSFSKFILHASIMNIKKCLGEVLERVFNIRI